MKRLFADTSYYIALVNADDVHHAAADEVARMGPIETVTHSWILVEVASAMADPRNRQLFVDLYRELQDDPRSIIVPTSDDLLNRGFELYSRRPDKAWSLTDCISFVVMEDMGLTEALTADHHYEQAGFIAILRR